MRNKIASHSVLLAAVLLLPWLPACFVTETADDSVNNDSLVKSVAFIGANFVALTTAAGGELKITTDAGNNWTTIAGRLIGGRFETVFFFDPEHGLGVNQQGQIWKTNDGGKTWEAGTKLKVSSQAGPFMSASQLEFIDQFHGWIVETFRIWKTDDGGNSWREVYSVMNPKTEAQPKSVLLVNNAVQWLTTSKGQLLHTTDGSESWNAVPFERNVSITDVAFVGERKGWAVGFRGLPPYTKLYRTDSASQTWEPLPDLERHSLITCITFVSENEGWAAGRSWTGENDTSGGLVLHTVNAGESWTPVRVGNEERFFDRIYFSDPQNGWLFSQDKVYKTSDAGKTWQVVLELSR